MVWSANILRFCKKYGSIAKGVGKTLLSLGKKEIEKIPGGSVIAHIFDIALETGKDILDIKYIEAELKKHAEVTQDEIAKFETKFQQSLSSIKTKDANQFNAITQILENSQESLEEFSEDIYGNLAEISDQIQTLIISNDEIKAEILAGRQLTADTEASIIAEVRECIKSNIEIMSVFPHSRQSSALLRNQQL